jgi:hypothetical protein
VQLGLVLGPFSMGQVLSAAMVAAGVVVLAAVFVPRPNVSGAARDATRDAASRSV